METINKLSIYLLLIFSYWTLSAQVLITDEVIESPSTIDPNALIEMRTTNIMDPGGMLIPKVDFAYSGGQVILENMETPTDGLIVYNIGTNVDKGIWYYDADQGRWVNFSNPSSTYSYSIDNYAEYYQVENGSSGYTYTLSTTTWVPWNTASYDAGAMGAKFEPLDDYTVNIGGGNTAPSDVLVVTEGGTYEVSFSAVYMRDNVNMSFYTTLHVNDVSQDKVRCISTLRDNDTYIVASGDGILQLNSGDIIDLRFLALEPVDGPMQVRNINLTLEKIGN